MVLRIVSENRQDNSKERTAKLNVYASTMLDGGQNYAHIREAMLLVGVLVVLRV